MKEEKDIIAMNIFCTPEMEAYPIWQQISIYFVNTCHTKKDD